MTDFGKVAVLLGGRTGLGAAEQGCGQARTAAQETMFAGMKAYD